jgi:hypothetical protein
MNPKWIMDESETNLVNTDLMQRIYFEDRGSTYKPRFRIVAETDHAEFVLYSSSDEGYAMEFFKDVYHDFVDKRSCEID